MALMTAEIIQMKIALTIPAGSLNLDVTTANALISDGDAMEDMIVKTRVMKSSVRKVSSC